jgi:hypothetical protein
VSGRVNAVISIGYAYPMFYYEASEDFEASFGAFGDATVQWPGRATCMAAIATAENPADFLTTCTPYFTITSVRPLQMWTASEIAALGGWTFSAQHFYDPLGKILYYGSGSTASAEALGDAVRTVAKPQETDYIVDFALGRDGSYYLLDIANGGNAIFRQDPAGNITQIAGNGVTDDPTGDGGPATEAVLGKSLIGVPFTLALPIGPDMASSARSIRTASLRPSPAATTGAVRSTLRTGIRQQRPTLASSWTRRSPQTARSISASGAPPLVPGRAFAASHRMESCRRSPEKRARCWETRI